MRKSRRFSIILVLILLLSMCCSSVFTGYAVTEEEKEAAEEEAREAKEASEAKRAEVKEAAKKAAAAVKDLEAAEAELTKVQGQIEATQAEIGSIRAEISYTQQKMEEKEAEIKDQNDALNDRLRAMYKTGNAGLVDVVLKSESIEDLLTNVGMVHKILDSDQKLLRKLQKDYEELQALKDKLVAQKAALEEKEIALEGQEEEAKAIKDRFQKEADRLKAMEDQLEAEAEALAAEAAAKQKEAEAMIVDAGLVEEVSAEGFAWPTQGNWYITSNYGWRICPFHGREFHSGVDIVLNSGTYGSPVYAIADGVVTRSSWYGSYGNCVIVAHGEGYTSLYAHLKGYNCSNGQTVKKGDVVGYIGSTGNSTGPHLHFTVFKNGSIINPLGLY